MADSGGPPSGSGEYETDVRTPDLRTSKRNPWNVAAVVVVLLGAVAIGSLVTLLVTRNGREPPVQPTSPPSDPFPALFARQRSGVLRVDVVSCGDQAWGGSGFVISDHEVLTAAHVVDGAVTIGLTANNETVPARVRGIDIDFDIALLRTDTPLSGSVFRLTDRLPRVGEEVAAFGYPAAANDPFPSLTFTKGVVSSLNNESEDDPDFGLLQTDAALNPGNSGGPLVDGRGRVVGVVVAGVPEAEGTAYARPGEGTSFLVDGWRFEAEPPDEPDCAVPLAPDEIPEPELVVDPGVELPDGILETIETYFRGINEGEYGLAWEQLAPVQQERAPLEVFREGVLTSYDISINVHSVDLDRRADVATVHVTFTSLQEAGYGPARDPDETCSNWSLDYTFGEFDVGWLIEAVAPHGSEASAPCG